MESGNPRSGRRSYEGVEPARVERNKKEQKRANGEGEANLLKNPKIENLKKQRKHRCGTEPTPGENEKSKQRKRRHRIYKSSRRENEKRKGNVGIKWISTRVRQEGK